ncbi:Solute carrier family 22 member 4 [Nymphon striatum]|nr:Solute carrier family 22 member 4 [Nymphon striatum]KAG1714400.1 Solute carrier family 22 member 4 [Nymphon striatum]KAG1714401.1 Solute carrier family 22 member 4 [Nymphon striatum]
MVGFNHIFYRQIKIAERTTLKKMPDLAKHVGHFGRWQFFIFIVCAATGIGGSMQVYVMTFFTPNLDYWCARSDSLRVEVSVKEWRNYSSPMEVVEGKEKRSSCDVYDADYEHMNMSELMDVSHNETRDCHKWEFDKGIYHRTMVEEFNLVCSRDILISTSNAVYMASFMISVLVCGHLADRFGRRKLMLICSLFLVIFSFVMAFSTSFVMFMVLRAFQCFFGMGLGTVSFTMFAETCSEKYIAVLGNFFFVGFSLGTISLTGIAYGLRNWFYIQLAIAAP